MDSALGGGAWRRPAEAQSRYGRRCDGALCAARLLGFVLAGLESSTGKSEARDFGGWLEEPTGELKLAIEPK